MAILRDLAGKDPTGDGTDRAGSILYTLLIVVMRGSRPGLLLALKLLWHCDRASASRAGVP